MKKYFSFIPFSVNQIGVIFAGTIIVVLIVLYVFEFEDADAYSVAHSQIIEYIDQSLMLNHWDIVEFNMYDESIELHAHSSAITPDPLKQNANDIARVNAVSMLRLWKDRNTSLNDLHGRLVRKNSTIKEFQPDTWESEILSNPAINEADITSVQTIGENALLRLFRPLRVTTRCVSCHTAWSEKENEFICGISVAVPMNELIAMKNKRVAKVGIMLFGIWIIGVVTFSIFALLYNKRRNDNENVESIRRRMESQLISVWDSSRDGMRITDERGNAVEVNNAYCMMVGIPKHEIIGKPFTSVYAPSYHEESLQKHNQRFKMRSIDSLIQREVTLWNGNRLWVEVSSSFMKLSDDSTNLLSVFRDITERKRTELVRQVQYDIAHAATTTEKSENFFASIQTNLSKLISTNNFYIALYDDDTGMVSFPYFIDEEDETPEPRTMGRGLTDYVIRTGSSVFGTLEKCNELERQGHIDSIGHPSAVWLGAPLKIGDRVFGVISVQSYTDPQCYSPADLKILEFVSNQISSAINRKQAEEQIRSQLSIIEETNKELGLARDIAIDASKAKSSFLANMSHELRTPLNAIIGYSEILIDEMGDADEKRYTSDIEKILTSGKSLLSLINDILDHSKIEAGRMELFIEEFNLHTLVNEIEDTIRPMVRSKSNTLTVMAPEESIVLRLDHTKVRQILFNLLSNSCKFSEKGNITLTVKKDQSKEKFLFDVVTFSVADTGIGMTDTQMKGLFKEFSQADNSIAKTYGGTGLGLTISKRFCEMMNGSIHVQSIPSKGTTFTVTLPITFEETETSAPETALTDSTPKDRTVFTSSTVLIIDDDPNVRDLLSRTLIKEGYAVQSADSGDDGIALARKIKPIVIILDVMMPKKDGWAVLREIKDDPELKFIPVVMHTIIDNRNLGFAVGAQDFLIKPVNTDVLVKLLDRYMQNSSALNILIVDDDQKQRDMISRILKKGKWNIQTADNGKSAIALLSQVTPDLIILDLMMPTMDGYEFLQIIKERDEWSHIPVLILSSMDLTKSDYERLSGSVADVLKKGAFDPRHLIKIVHRFSQLPLTKKSVPLE